MARIGRIRKVSTGIESYTYLMNGVAGIGKTTTVCNIGLKKFGQDGFFLMTLGAEPEPDHIGGIWNEVYKDEYKYDKRTEKDVLVSMGWERMIEDLDAIIEERDTEYKDLKMIGIDSIGELFSLAETFVIEEYNQTVTKTAERVKTINGAYGGYGRGKKRVIELVTKFLLKIKDANLSVFFIGHTKQKNTTDIFTETTFEQITSDIETAYYNCIKDRVNIVMCAYMDRRYSDLKTKKDNFTKEDKQVGKLESENRIVAFRDDNFAIDLKCHLTHMPNTCELNSDTIINELEKAINLQAEDHGGQTTTRTEILEERKKENEEKLASKEDDINDKKEKINKIQENLSNIDMGELQRIMRAYEVTSFGDASLVPSKCLNEILELIK